MHYIIEFVPVTEVTLTKAEVYNLICVLQQVVGVTQNPLTDEEINTATRFLTVLHNAEDSMDRV